MTGTCLHCGGGLKRVDHDVARGLDVVAGALVRALTRPPTLECPTCGTIDSAALAPLREARP